MIIQHMKDDDNALKHAYWGRFTFAITLALGIVLGLDWWVIAATSLFAPFAIAGAGIEVIQRFQRARDKNGKWLGFFHDGQNSIKESLLDMMQTGLFYITYLVNRDNK